MKLESLLVFPFSFLVLRPRPCFLLLLLLLLLRSSLADQAGSSYDIPKKLQEVFGPLRAADEIIDEGHIIGKVSHQ